MVLLGECVISSVLCHHNKNLKRQTLKPLVCHSSKTDGTDRVSALGQTVLQLSFIYKIKEYTSLSREGMPTQKTRRESEKKSEHTGERNP